MKRWGRKTFFLPVKYWGVGNWRYYALVDTTKMEFSPRDGFCGRWGYYPLVLLSFAP